VNDDKTAELDLMSPAKAWLETGEQWDYSKKESSVEGHSELHFTLCSLETWLA
jgi:hypothetical protein